MNEAGDDAAEAVRQGAPRPPSLPEGHVEAAAKRWTDGAIAGCTVEPLAKHDDRRGWLAEIFRRDELEADLFPAMGYFSLTHPNVTRGPHAHHHQTDLFAFFNGALRVYLWDERQDSPTYGHRMVLDVGAANQVIVRVPPGVVHAYRNVGENDALSANFPNRLYAGERRQEPVDEIRYEDVENSPFRLD